MSTSEWQGSEDLVAERVGTYIKDMRNSGADLSDCVILMKKGLNGVFSGAVGSREGLISQVREIDRGIARSLKRELRGRKDSVPVYAMDLNNDTSGLEWLGPFPNTFGGKA